MKKSNIITNKTNRHTKKNNINSHNNIKHKYIIPNSINYKNTLKLNKILEKRGNWETNNNQLVKNNKIEFGYLLGHLKNMGNNIKNFNLVNSINDTKKIITRKDKLYELLKKNKNIEEHLLEQYKIDLNYIINSTDNFYKYKKLFKNNKIWTFKIVDNWGNSNLFNIFNHYNDFQEYAIHILETNMEQFEYLINNKKDNKKDNKFLKSEWVLQNYITNPLLIQRKRFNIKLYFIFNASENKSYLVDKGIIQLANDNFKLDDFYDKNIHHTQKNMNNINNNLLIYPDNFIKYYGKSNTNEINNQIFFIISQISELLTNQTKNQTPNENYCYTKTQKCFELFTVDIIIDTKFKVKLLETNYIKSYPIINININKNIDFVEYIFNETLLNIVDKLYTPHIKIKENTNLIQL